jgi:hypothetical protein
MRSAAANTYGPSLVVILAMDMAWAGTVTLIAMSLERPGWGIVAAIERTSRACSSSQTAIPSAWIAWSPRASCHLYTGSYFGQAMRLRTPRKLPIAFGWLTKRPLDTQSPTTAF